MSGADLNRYVVVVMVRSQSIMDTAYVGPFRDHDRAVKKAEQIERGCHGNVTALVADLFGGGTATADVADYLGVRG